ncbi:60S ribosomal protein L2, mitochondrial [Dendrobium catenatum]|uniref:Large ribosomal subunit protein uL2m n=1 Tax=Dendrobium catenatum TaxID=906689 RepID=A0A2I0VAL4_9ASPA|nr:60S ribosomal protein L2, mitochondrial [Dendrobium catenatum]
MRKSLKGRALLNFTLSTGKSAGRNSSGRITVFHRGGGSKRLQRKIDLKRSTSSMGIVERIEYDPNRSSRIALVRWIEGVLLRRQRKCNTNTIEEFAPPRQILESTTATIFCLFSFSSLPRKVDQRKDVFFSALPSPLAKGETAFLSFGSSLAFPRIAIAGAKPAFFAPRMREKLIGKKTFSPLCEIRKGRTHCVLWAHRIKRQAALSWQSLRQQENLGLVGAAEHNESKPKADQGSLPATKNGACKVDRAPVVNTYILASHRLEAGQMVMNCDWSKPYKSGFLRPAQNAHTYRRYEILDLNSQVGNCIPLADIRMGTLVHDIEYHPGKGAMLARAAGTSAKIMKEPASQCLVRLPSGVEKLIDSRCRATIGIVSNPHHGARKLRKAGQSRWLGRRPIVRGVAMNPVDHPHGGGEGRTKGGRPSVSPWGKPTKAGFRAVVGVGKRRI